MEMLEKLHTGHLGLVQCRQRARQSVWWPSLGNQLEELITNCSTSRQHRANKVGPLITIELPNLTWQKIATDLLEFRKSQYLLVIDYYLRYVELAKLSPRCSYMSSQIYVGTPWDTAVLSV